MQIDDNSVNRFEHGEDAIAWMIKFSQDASRSIDIFSYTLMPELFCGNELVSAISTLARRSAASQVRILLRDSKPLSGVDHALVNLARRLPTHVKIRTLIEDTSPPNIGFLCADEKDLVFFNDEANHTGFARSDAQAESKHFLDAFNHQWQSGSKTDPNLRMLSL